MSELEESIKFADMYLEHSQKALLKKLEEDFQKQLMWGDMWNKCSICKKEVTTSINGVCDPCKHEAFKMLMLKVNAKFVE